LAFFFSKKFNMIWFIRQLIIIYFLTNTSSENKKIFYFFLFKIHNKLDSIHTIKHLRFIKFLRLKFSFFPSSFVKMLFIFFLLFHHTSTTLCITRPFNLNNQVLKSIAMKNTKQFTISKMQIFDYKYFYFSRLYL